MNKSTYIAKPETFNVPPVVFANNKIEALAKGLIPAVNMIGIIIVPTKITIPKPFEPAKITDAATYKTNAIIKGLSPANSAAFLIIPFTIPTRFKTCPKNEPNTKPAIAELNLIAPCSKTLLAIV